MIITFDVTKVTIVAGRGMDKVSLHTTEDSPFVLISDGPLWLDFAVTAGDGFRYVTEVLKIDEELVEVINV